MSTSMHTYFHRGAPKFRQKKWQTTHKRRADDPDEKWRENRLFHIRLIPISTLLLFFSWKFYRAVWGGGRATGRARLRRTNLATWWLLGLSDDGGDKRSFKNWLVQNNGLWHLPQRPRCGRGLGGEHLSHVKKRFHFPHFCLVSLKIEAEYFSFESHFW